MLETQRTHTTHLKTPTTEEGQDYGPHVFKALFFGREKECFVLWSSFFLAQTLSVSGLPVARHDTLCFPLLRVCLHHVRAMRLCVRLRTPPSTATGPSSWLTSHRAFDATREVISTLHHPCVSRFVTSPSALHPPTSTSTFLLRVSLCGGANILDHDGLLHRGPRGLQVFAAIFAVEASVCSTPRISTATGHQGTNTDPSCGSQA